MSEKNISNNDYPYAAELLNLTKSFGGSYANKDVNLQLKKGEIHALLGENGAGKSTLMNMLFGLVTPDYGEIKIDGRTVDIKSPKDANDMGIGMVHQHFMLIDIYSVIDNIILGDEPAKAGVLVRKEARKRVTELSEKYGLFVNPDALVSDITVGMQQRVEILKMLYRNNNVLIFDEPTAVLTPREIGELMKTMKKLSEEGHSILFITHHMDEIMQVADRCTILSKGRCVGTVNVKDTTKQELSKMMVGREVSLTMDKKPSDPGKVILEVKDLFTLPGKGHALEGVSFEIRSGEIVCIAGIDGNGQSELAEAVTGMMNIKSGNIILDGEDISNYSIKRRSRLGISHIPEDRLKHGIIPEYSVEKNLILQRYDEKQFTGKAGFLRKKAIREFTKELSEKFDIRFLNGPEDKIGTLSGGNQQKAVVARELEKEPKLLVAVQPVRGLDVGAVEKIHEHLVEQRDKGSGVLLISFELEEVLNVADRILVMFEGKISAELYPGKTDANELGFYMAGGKDDKEVSAV